MEQEKSKEEKIKMLIQNAEESIDNCFNTEEDLKTYLTFMSKFHEYSYHNAIMIQTQFPGALAVGSYQFWKEQGFHVKRGEKGISILVPLVRKTRFVDEDGNIKSLEEANPTELKMIEQGKLNTFSNRVSFKTSYVFDVSQTNATPDDLPKLFPNKWLDGNVENYERIFSILHSYAKTLGYEVYMANDEMGATKGVAYHKAKNIILNHRNSQVQNVKTLVHEIAHALLHPDSELSRDKKEFQAEMTAYSVCGYFGIDTSDYSFQYMKGWIGEKKLKDKKVLLKEVSEAVNKVTGYVEEKLFENQEITAPFIPPMPESEETKNYSESVGEQLSFNLTNVKSGSETDEKREQSTDKKKIEDFGEKIGGAKKDTWRKRGITIADIDDMNEAEGEKYIKKDNIWKKPDYISLIDDGLPVHAAFFMKKVRDAIPTKPYYGRNDKTFEERRVKQNYYVEMVQDIKNAMSEVRSDEDIIAFYNQFVRSEKYVKVSSSISYRLELTEKGFHVTNKLIRAMRENASSLAAYDRMIEKEQFGVSAEKKIPKGYSIKKYDGSGYVKNNDWKDGTYYITKGYHVLKENIETYDEAFHMVKEIAGSKVSRRKKKFVPEQLENIERIGCKWKDENENIDGERYLKDFGFRGGEFGNWMNEVDRQGSLNYGYDALCDLADALDIQLSDISLGNKLSIAFGARGSGTAVAHYEPMRQVINLTKMKGAGSLAHEWGHALDDILGKELGIKGFISGAERSGLVPESFRELMQTLKYRPATQEEIEKSKEKAIRNAHKSFERWVDNYVPDSKLNADDIVKKKELCKNIIDAAKANTIEASFCINGEGDKNLDQFNVFVKEKTGHVIPKSERNGLYWSTERIRSAYSVSEKTPKVKSEYYKNSIKFDALCSKEDKGYWQSNEEMFARAFACYVHDKLKERGFRSDYLCGHSELAITFDFNDDMKVIKAIPEGEERKAINRCFDKVIAEFKKRGLLTEISKNPMKRKMTV